jgi:hypothetical protein
MSKIQPPTAIDFDPAIAAKDKDEQPILMIDVRFSRTGDIKNETIPKYSFFNVCELRCYQNI